jgi:hypothetical protein
MGWIHLQLRVEGHREVPVDGLILSLTVDLLNV